MTVLGMNIEQGRQLANVMRQDAQTITDLTNRLTQLLIDTEWYGNDRDQFVGQWEGDFKPALIRLVQALVENGGVVDQQATDQENASS